MATRTMLVALMLTILPGCNLEKPLTDEDCAALSEAIEERRRALEEERARLQAQSKALAAQQAALDAEIAKAKADRAKLEAELAKHKTKAKPATKSD